MIAADPVPMTESKPVIFRRATQGNDPGILADIYQADINMAIWQHELSLTIQETVKAFLAINPAFRASMTVTPQSVFANLDECFAAANQSELKVNIAELVDMFCYLFDLKRVGLRLTVLDRAMCPRFHVDRVPCRLITTYQGVATEWLSHQVVDRSKLGTGNNGKPDHASGLFQSQQDIQRLSSGDVALLKGELWEGNENAGLVHRSPAPANAERRLLLTLDFVN